MSCHVETTLCHDITTCVAYNLTMFCKLSAEILPYFVFWELEVYKIWEETNSSSLLYII